MPSAAAAAGIRHRPSPQALSMGGPFPSATTTRSPLRRAAMAVASPAGPPPITKTSVSAILTHIRCQSGGGRENKDAHRISRATAAAVITAAQIHPSAAPQ